MGTRVNDALAHGRRRRARANGSGVREAIHLHLCERGNGDRLSDMEGDMPSAGI